MGRAKQSRRQGPKLPYPDWLRYCRAARRLHLDHGVSYTDLGHVCGQSGGWAKSSLEHRALVRWKDIEAVEAELVRLDAKRAEAREESEMATDLKDDEKAEAVAGLEILHARLGTWQRVGGAIGMTGAGANGIRRSGGACMRTTYRQILAAVEATKPKRNSAKPHDALAEAERIPDEQEAAEPVRPLAWKERPLLDLREAAQPGRDVPWNERVRLLLLDAAAEVDGAASSAPVAFRGPYNALREQIEGIIEGLGVE